MILYMRLSYAKRRMFAVSSMKEGREERCAIAVRGRRVMIVNNLYIFR